MHDTNGLVISWDTVTDDTCAWNPVNYSVTVVRESDGMVFATLYDVNENRTEVMKMLEPNQKYNVSVSARITTLSNGSTCEGEPATVVCSTSDSSPPGIYYLLYA